jgi:eukaryotic-like serine/threonine-protein kinase
MGTLDPDLKTDEDEEPTRCSDPFSGVVTQRKDMPPPVDPDVPTLITTAAAEAAVPDPPPGAPPEGTLIGGIYRVIRTLGVGAMGVILLGLDVQLERHVAIKLLHPAQTANRELQSRLLDEARAMARVHHPNVVEIHAFGEHRGALYFVMQYVEGATLNGYVHQRGGPPLDLDEAMSILDQTCRGVTAIHQSGSTHRDIKPSNILVGPALRVAVADLGLARKYKKGQPGALTVSGTPAFLAPEVALERPVDPDLVSRIDVYALGLIAYWLLAGRLPFDDRDVATLIKQHISVIPAPPSSVNRSLPAAFDAVILGALAKEPGERTGSAEELRLALQEARNHAPSSWNHLRVLIADDSGDFRAALADVVEMAFPGAVVDSVPDGAQALESITKAPPSLAVFDLDMPGLDGIALTAAVRALPHCKSFPIIVATGSGGAADWHRLSRLGASAFLVKPFEVSQLITLARGLLDVAEPRIKTVE